MPDATNGGALTREELLERLPGIIAENTWNGQARDGIPHFALAQKLGAHHTHVRKLVEKLADAGLVSVSRAAKGSREYLWVKPADADHGGAGLPPPRYRGGPPDPAEVAAALPILYALEEIEAELINVGIYETFVEPAEVADRAGRPLAEVRAALGVLERDFEVLWPERDRVRSRLSEICRLLKLVKQRFGRDDADSAPSLIRSLKVAFRTRRRQRRDPELEVRSRLEALARRFPGQRPGLAVAAEALATALRSAVGLEAMPLTRVQATALEHIGGAYLARDARNTSFVITGDTGSGKTEAFALPVLLGALDDVLAGLRGTKVVLVYPRIRLAANQAQRIAGYLASLSAELGPRGRLTLGIQQSLTPQNDKTITNRERFGSGYRFDEFRCPRPVCGGELALHPATSPRLNRLTCETAGCGWSFDAFVGTRDAIAADPPDILIITTESLHRWLMQVRYAAVFGLGPVQGFVPPRAIVLDEIHLYDTIHGAQVTRLLQRVRHRVKLAMAEWPADPGGAQWREPLLIGLSATIGQPERFWQKFTGSRPAVISPAPGDYDETLGREYFVFLRPESESRGRNVSVASASIQSLMVLMHNMRKRVEGGIAKHRGLVFVESIDRLKRLHTDFINAEEVNRLWELRIPAVAGGDELTPQDPPPREIDGWDEGEVWYFDAQDPAQHAEQRPVPGDPPASLRVSRRPVFSGAEPGSLALSGADLVFATTSLEVGFDDPSMQLVYQHRSPRNVASFVQKKGRGGRGANDRSFMAIMLSPESYLDAFYYQNPGLLTDPADYEPALNEDNYFVQSAHGLAAAVDSWIFRRALEGAKASNWGDDTVRLRGRLRAAFEDYGPQMQAAFEAVTTYEFRGREPKLGPLWQKMLASLREPPPEVERQWLGERTDLVPRSLFSSINLPNVRIEFADGSSDELDVSLAAFEAAPGNVTTRFGYNELRWCPPVKALRDDPRVGFVLERQTRHAYDPAAVRDLAGAVDNYAALVPAGAAALYPAGVPGRFFRPERLFMAQFGTYDPGRAARVRWYYCPTCDHLANEPGSCRVCNDSLRRLHHKTSSRLLSFPLVHQPDDAGHLVPAPRPLDRVLAEVQVFAGYSSRDATRPSYLDGYTVYYGVDVSYAYTKPGGGYDTEARTYGLRTPVAVGAEDMLYGFATHAEGIILDFAPDALEATAADAFRQLPEAVQRWARRSAFVHAVATRAPKTNGNGFFRGRLAEYAATAAALLPPGVPPGQAWHDAVVRGRACAEAAAYWLHAQRFSGDDALAYQAELDREEMIAFVAAALDAELTAGADARVAADLLGHGLEHVAKAIVVTVGGVPETEVSGFVRLHHLGTGAPGCIVVFERGEWGNGATRLVHDLFRGQRGDETFWRRLWRQAGNCPVGDEEDFLRWLLRERYALVEEARRELLVQARGAAARHIPDRMVERALGQRLAAGVDGQAHPFVAALGRLALGEERIGEDRIPHLGLYGEVDRIRRAFEERCQRPPSLVELGNLALARVCAEPGAFPHLARIWEIYGALPAHAAPGDEIAAEHLDIDAHRLDQREVRFVVFVERFALSSCIDGCPACLAVSCDLGLPANGRGLLSRRLLRGWLVALLLQDAISTDGAGIDEVLAAARAGTQAGDWVVLTGADATRFQEARQRLAAHFSPLDTLLDYEGGRNIAIFTAR